jgi:hypothetical protein
MPGIDCYTGMRNSNLRFCCVVLLLTFNMQSLVDIAREEAERRKQLEEQGIEPKIIDGNSSGSRGRANITTSSEMETRHKELPVGGGSEKSGGSLKNFKTGLQKLDRTIEKTAALLAAKRARLQAEKWANPKVLKASGQTRDPLLQLQAEIEELQIKLKQLREERFRLYEAGRKAGFLPGELEGKGLIP